WTCHVYRTCKASIRTSALSVIRKEINKKKAFLKPVIVKQLPRALPLLPKKERNFPHARF
ncbi:MAG: hypothetical protein COY70_01860, partial [Candidatus Magasanikbacteria bacterium CG_4_10_14_0_8_um_filter_42_12]